MKKAKIAKVEVIDPPVRGVGRPRIEIPAPQVEGLARLGATNVEIAQFFGCSDDTITRNYAENLSKGRAARKIRLREWQWRAAENGNVAMMIFLGKNILGQTDKGELTLRPGQPVNQELKDMKTDDLYREARKRGIDIPDRAV